MCERELYVCVVCICECPYNCIQAKSIPFFNYPKARSQTRVPWFVRNLVLCINAKWNTFLGHSTHIYVPSVCVRVLSRWNHRKKRVHAIYVHTHTHVIQCKTAMFKSLRAYAYFPTGLQANYASTADGLFHVVSTYIKCIRIQPPHVYVCVLYNVLCRHWYAHYTYIHIYIL